MNATPAHVGHVQDFEGAVAAERCACGATANVVKIARDTGAVTVECSSCSKPWPLLSYEQTETERLKALYQQHLATANDLDEREPQRTRAREAMRKILAALKGRGLEP